MDLLPALGLIGILFVKEAGVPIPIPGDLLVLGAGVAAAGTGAGGVVVLAAILVAGFAGGSVQFLIVRGTLRERLLRVVARLGVPRERLEALADWVRQRGARGVAIARATPGLRVGAIAASGVAELPYGVFLPGLVAGNTLFVGGHFFLGFVVGPAALAVASGTGGAVMLVGAFALAGAVAWAIVRRRRLQRAHVVPAGGMGGDNFAGYGTWAEAACPACLAVTIIASGRQS